jgi:hypothetical protein
MKQMSTDYRGKNHRKKDLKHGLLKHGAHTNRTDEARGGKTNASRKARSGILEADRNSS